MLVLSYYLFEKITYKVKAFWQILKRCYGLDNADLGAANNKAYCYQVANDAKQNTDLNNRS